MMSKKQNQFSATNILNYNLYNGSYTGETKEKLSSEPRAIIYSRVSDKKQVMEGFGLESQQRTCSEWCKKQSPPIPIDRIFIEPGVSGAISNRKELNACLQYMAQNNKHEVRITHFVVSEASRISRAENIAEAHAIEDKIKSYGVKIIKVNNPGLNASTPAAEYLNDISYASSKFERKDFMRRVSESRLARLEAGHRPFCKPPLGYVRERISKKDYIDNIDPIRGPMIKEGLELFATDVLMTTTDLRKFWNNMGLRTESKKMKQLRRTFPGKCLQLHRLFYYAGYVIYPKRGVNEPIDAKHDGLISLSTVHTIIKKMQRSQTGNQTNPVSQKMSDEHPLRGVISCPSCKRKYTSRNTKKYRVKNGERIVKLYPYYGCAKNGCPQRLNVAKKFLESEFENLVSEMKLPDEILQTIDICFEKIRNNSINSFNNRSNHMKGSMSKINSRQQEIEDTLLRISNPSLTQKLEQERGTLQTEKEQIKNRIDDQKYARDSMKTLLNKTKMLFSNPIKLWHNGSASLRHLLVRVRFGDQLYYTKKVGLRTSQSTTLYGVLAHLGAITTLFLPSGSKPQTEVISTFNELESEIKDKMHFINSARSIIEREDLGRLTEDGRHILTLNPE